MDVFKPNPIEKLERARDFGMCCEHRLGFVNSHFQDVRDRIPLVEDLQSRFIETLSITFFAANIDVGEKVHFDLANAVSFATFTASTFDVEGKASRLVAVHS